VAVKFSTKLFLIFTLAFGGAVVVSTGAGLRGVRRGFAQLEAERIAASVELTRHELDRQGQDVDHRVGAVADSEATTRMALDINGPKPDLSIYAADALGVATHQGLELFEFLTDDGTIISSYHAPDRLGQKDAWVRAAADQNTPGAFLTRVDTSQGPVIAQVSVRAVRVGEKKMYLFGGRRLDERLLSSLVLPAGVRPLLYLNLDGKGAVQNLLDAKGEQSPAGPLATLVTNALQQPESATRAPFPSDSAAETFYALPVAGADRSALAVVVFGHTAIERLSIERVFIQQALLAVALGILLGWVVSLWGAARISRPLERLAASARAMAAGSTKAHADERGNREIAAMARALNETMEKLAAERARLVQTERVAAWREMARRAVYDFDAALARLDSAAAVRAGSTGEGSISVGPSSENSMLRESLEGLREAEKRLREFADLLVLPMQAVRLNDIVRNVVRDFEPLFSSPVTEATRPPIHPEVHLAEDLPAVQADPELLTRAVDLLMLFAVNSMPAGGTFTLRTEATASLVHLEIYWAGAAPAPEETDRGFTPGGLGRRYSTGLELATVQAIISDHGGSMSISSADGYTRLRLQIPAAVAPAESPEPAREPQPAD
jgi:signal transduction histidine kinase